MNRVRAGLLLGLVHLLFLCGSSRAAFTITVGAYDFTNSGFNAAQQTLAQTLVNNAINAWTSTVTFAPYNNLNITVTKFGFSTLAADVSGLGVTRNASADANGNPNTVAEIFVSSRADMYYSVGLAGIGAAQYDAYSTILHELGHAVGFNYRDNTGDGYLRWNQRVNTATNNFLLLDGLTNIALGAGNNPNGWSHVAGNGNDLMNVNGVFATRFGITPQHLSMLQTAFGTPAPPTFLLMGLGGFVLIRVRAFRLSRGR